MGVFFKFFISILFFKKKVYCLSGLRRSGNHACANWLLNAIENKDTNFHLLEPGLSFSESKETVFFNEMNRRGKICFLRFIIRYFFDISKANSVVISTEDYIPAKFDPFTPIGGIVIFIHRTTLNIVASRLKKASSRADNGMEEGDMKIDHHFISVAKNIKKEEQKGTLIWHFDLWLSTNDNYKIYRQDFLNQLNLNVDIQPGVSHEGGGSSFSGTNEFINTTHLSRRYTQIYIPNKVRALLLLAQSRELIRDEDLTYLLDY